MANKVIKDISKYSKETISLSDRYAEYKDIINAELDDDNEYSMDEVDNIISDFLKREVR